jgi:hypothetical protein
MYSFYSAGFVSHTGVELRAIAFEFDLRRSHFALIVLDARPVRNRLFLREDAMQPASTAKNRVFQVMPNLLDRFFVACKPHL